MEIRCQFGNSSVSGYTCDVSCMEIPEDVELKFIGKHETRKCDKDVISIWFENCIITKVPQGLTKKFPNLEKISIENSNLINLSKNDLVEYKNLKKLEFDYNEIDFLPGDLFEDFKNLELISLCGNKLIVVEPNILDGLDKLEHVFLDENTDDGSSDSDSLDSSDSHSDSKFSEIKVKLRQEFFKHDIPFLMQFPLTQQAWKILAQEFQQRCKNLEDAKLENNKNASNNSKFTADIKNFIKGENFKDFKIKIDDREFHVHKFLLAARSPTLAEILQNNPDAKNMNMVDISVEIFEIILKFLYTDELPREDGTNFLHLFAAAGQLKIEELKNFATQKILDEFDGKNALEIFKLSNKYGHGELRQKAFEKIKKDIQKFKFIY